MSAVPKKTQQEKFQAILMQLLKEEENKYCADCETKGPRWASWNLGLFLCIRCAGIHRNLGVHISRVKSVNLDSWTPEQLSVMMELGNAKAKSAYEAHLPENFRRPLTDSSLEQFIRQKYEQRKYVPSGWQPPQVSVRAELFENGPSGSTKSERSIASASRAKAKKESSSLASLPAVPSAPLGLNRIADQPVSASRTRTLSSSSSDLSSPHASSSANANSASSKTVQPVAHDLLGLDDATPPVSQSGNASNAAQVNSLDDFFGELVSAAPLPQTTANVPVNVNVNVNANAAKSTAAADDLTAVFSAPPATFSAPASVPTPAGFPTSLGTAGTEASAGGAMSTSAILALYGASKPQNALYTPPQQQFAGLNLSGPLPSNAAPNSNSNVNVGALGRPNPFGISQSNTTASSGGQTLISDLWH